MFFLRNLSLIPWGLIIIAVFFDALSNGGYSKLVNWLFFICLASSGLGCFVNYYFRCKFCGKRALFEDDGGLFSKRNYFACRCMNCGAPLKRQ